MFVLEPPTTKVKPQRNRDYWDVKFIGAFQRRDEENDRWIQVPVEQKLMPLVDHLNEKHATDSLNHGIRRGNQLLTIIDSYYPREIYGINWEDEDLYADLHAHWKYMFITGRRKRSERPVSSST
jgi:hypothetical protein